MKKFILILIVLAFGVPALAHPPKDISLNVSPAGLEVFVSHPSANISEHFIKAIRVFLNGEKIADQSFSSQEMTGQKLSFPVPGLKKGDKIKVQAQCSVYGTLEKEFSPAD